VGKQIEIAPGEPWVPGEHDRLDDAAYWRDTTQTALQQRLQQDQDENLTYWLDVAVDHPFVRGDQLEAVLAPLGLSLSGLAFPHPVTAASYDDVALPGGMRPDQAAELYNAVATAVAVAFRQKYPDDYARARRLYPDVRGWMPAANAGTDYSDIVRLLRLLGGDNSNAS